MVVRKSVMPIINAKIGTNKLSCPPSMTLSINSPAKSGLMMIRRAFRKINNKASKLLDLYACA